MTIPVITDAESEQPISTLSNEDLLALSKIQMDKEEGERLGELLEKQRENILTETEQLALAMLMQVYHRLWIRQSEALVEAVKRGLRPPLE